VNGAIGSAAGATAVPAATNSAAEIPSLLRSNRDFGRLGSSTRCARPARWRFRRPASAPARGSSSTAQLPGTAWAEPLTPSIKSSGGPPPSEAGARLPDSHAPSRGSGGKLGRRFVVSTANRQVPLKSCVFGAYGKRSRRTDNWACLCAKAQVVRGRQGPLPRPSQRQGGGAPRLPGGVLLVLSAS